MRVWSWMIFGCLVGLHACAAQGQSSNTLSKLRKLLRVVPIETTADDVRRSLGEPIRKAPDFHEFEEFNMSVDYASGLPCGHSCIEKGRACGWNVPRDRVITFVVFVKTAFHQKDLRNLGIDLSNYKQEKAGHIPESIYYSNDEKGIGIIINGDAVTSINLFPAKKYLYLMCRQACEKPVCPSEALAPTLTKCGQPTAERP
jgi:hypothetical protein